jgi:hypothetical protein
MAADPWEVQGVRVDDRPARLFSLMNHFAEGRAASRTGTPIRAEQPAR